MICCVIANTHLMVGCDFHDSFPTFFGPMVPLGPHLVAARVRWGLTFMAGDMEAEKVLMPPGTAISKIFDIGMGIPHVPLVPNVYFWLYMLTSSSQGHFGVSSVQTEKGSIAVAVLGPVNAQLNCEGSLSWPPWTTGFVDARNTVVAGMTAGDVLAGFISMTITSAVTFGLAHLLDKGPKLVMGFLIRVVPPQIMLPTVIAGVALTQRFPPLTRAISQKIVETLVGWGVGSPMGWSFGTSGPIPSPWSAPFGSMLTGDLPFGIPGPSIQEASEGAAAFISENAPSILDEYYDSSVLLPPFPWTPLPVPILVPAP